MHDSRRSIEGGSSDPDRETRAHIETLAGVVSRGAAAGWRTMWMAIASLLFGVLFGFVTLRKEAARSVIVNAHDPDGETTAALRRALDAERARAQTAEARVEYERSHTQDALRRLQELSVRPAPMVDSVSLEATRRELLALRARLDAAEAQAGPSARGQSR